MDCRVKLKPDEKALLQKLQRGTWTVDGVFNPTPQRGIFQRLSDRNSPGSDLDGQGRNAHRCLRLLAFTPSAHSPHSRP
jgi:hypothetical protein